MNHSEVIAPARMLMFRGSLPARVAQFAQFRAWTVFTVLLITGFVLFAWSLRSYFVGDDYEFLGRVDLHNASKYFFKSWAYGNEFRPLLAYSYAVDRLFSGGSPVGYHVTNSIIHIVNAFLLVEVALTLRVPRATAALAGVLFLANPVCHEAVLWISGRPVILSSLFQLLSIWLFVSGERQSRPYRLALSVLCLALALMTYEGAVATPFVLLVLFAVCGSVKERRRVMDIAPFGIVLVAYSAVWLWTFHFHLVRARQHSITNAFFSMGEALLHGWHGAYRPEVGSIFALALVWFLRQKENRAFAAAMLLLFFAGYLPFFAMAAGFADRFDYFAVMPLCVLLAGLLVELFRRHRRVGILAILALLTFFAVGLEDRVRQWRQAGEIARAIPAQVVALKPAVQAGTVIAISGVPDMWKHAYVFLTGLPHAISYRYGRNVSALKIAGSACSAKADVYFKYDGGRVQEVNCKER